MVKFAIMSIIKIWYRCLGRCSKEHLQGYLDEYHFIYKMGIYGGNLQFAHKKMVLNEPKRLNNNKLKTAFETPIPKIVNKKTQTFSIL